MMPVRTPTVAAQAGKSGDSKSLCRTNGAAANSDGQVAAAPAAAGPGAGPGPGNRDRQARAVTASNLNS